MKAISRGYLSINPADIRQDPWGVELDGELLLTPSEHLDNWSYYQTLTVRSTIVADASALLEGLKLNSDAVLGFVILWVSPGTSMRGASEVVAIESAETTVALLLPGGQLRGDLRLEAQIVLLSPSAHSRSVLSPSVPGAILWSSAHSIRLEGIGSRMPVLVVPFSKHLAAGGNHGLWWLQLSSTDFESPADSCLWMWLNEENEAIEELLSYPASASSQRTQQFLKADFYRQLIFVGLRDEDFDMSDDYPSGSLGAVIAAPMLLLGESMDELRSQYRFAPMDLEARLQARLGGL